MALKGFVRKSTQGSPMATNLGTGRRLGAAEGAMCEVTGLDSPSMTFGILLLILTPMHLGFRKTTSAAFWPHCLRGSLLLPPASPLLRDQTSRSFLMDPEHRFPWCGHTNPSSALEFRTFPTGRNEVSTKIADKRTVAPLDLHSLWVA